VASLTRASARRSSRRSFLVRRFPGALLVCLVGGGIAAFYLGLYSAKGYSLPIGWDTPRYLYQTHLVAELGLGGVPDSLPPPANTLQGRPAFPVVSLVMSNVFDTSTFKAAVVVPVAAAVALSLAAGALISWSFHRSLWEMAAVAGIVGTSTLVVRLMAPETYSDNLFSAALVTAALVPVLSAVHGGTGLPGAVLLLGAAGVAHPPTFVLVLAVLGLVAVFNARGSWVAWRGGEIGWTSTPAGRVAIVGGGAAAVAGLGIFGALRAIPDTPELTRLELEKKMREDLPLYRLPLTVPLAALGAAVVSPGGTDRPLRERLVSRLFLALAGAWAFVVVVGIAAFWVGLRSPGHRFLAFLIPLPMLTAVGILGLGRLAARGARVAGVAVVLAGILGLAYLGYRDLYVRLPVERGVEWLEAGKVQDALAAAAYLDAVAVPQASPVVFVIDDTGPNPLSYVPEMAYIIRSVIPAGRIEQAHFYVGDPERYLAGEPTYRDTPRTYNENARRFWPAIERLLPERPVALTLASYNPRYQDIAVEHPEWIVATNVVALHGPRPPAPLPSPSNPHELRRATERGLLAGGTLVVLTLVGIGWAVALLPAGTRSFEVLALSPALGIGFLVLGGLLADLMGIRLGELGGSLITATTVLVVGFALGARRLRAQGRSLFPAR
jgi:hypothetical protein